MTLLFLCRYGNLETLTTFFRIFSIFAFRCMVKLPLIGVEIAPAIAIKFSGLV